MATVEYLPTPVADPTTGQVRSDLFGSTVTFVDAVTGVPLTGLVEKGSGVPLANPVTVSTIGFTPWVTIEDGPLRADAVSGSFRTPLLSFGGLDAIATEALSKAAQALTAAQGSVRSVNGAQPDPNGNVTVAATGGTGGVSSFTALTDVPTEFQTSPTKITGATALGRTLVTVADQLAARTAIAAVDIGTVRTEVATLNGGAPATLNNLDKVAASIGDDPAFAATIGGKLNTKATDARRVVVYFNETTWTWPARPTLTAGQYVVWDAADTIVGATPIPLPTLVERDRYNPAPNDPIRDLVA